MADVYNIIYQGEFCTNTDGTNNIISFSKRMSDADPVPDIIEIIFSGHEDEPVIIEYQDKGDYKLERVNGCGCTVNIKAISNFELSSLYTSDEREWKVEVVGFQKFSGWLIPDSCAEPYQSKPYDVSVQATDAIGTLEDIPFAYDDGVKYSGFKTDIEIINICLNKTGLGLPLAIGVNTFENSMDTGICPLEQTYRNTARYIDEDGNPFDCLTVLNTILTHWSARLHQFNGKWQIVNVMELTVGAVNAWDFLSDNTAVGTSSIGNAITAGGIDRDLQPSEGQNQGAKAFKSSTAYYQYGYPTDELTNGNFNDATVPGVPNHWIASGGATGETYYRVDEATGLDTSDVVFVVTSNGVANDGYFTNDVPVQIRANQKVLISFDLSSIGAYLDVGASTEKRNVDLVIKDNFGNFYTDKNGWQSAGGFYTIRYLSIDFKNTLKPSFEVTQKDVDYQLTFSISAVKEADELLSFDTKYNNVSIAGKAVSDQTSTPLGVFNRQTMIAKQTYKPEPLLLLHGDELNLQRTSVISINDANPTVAVNHLWRRNGILDPISGLPESQSLLHIVANSELRLHHRPYNIFTAKFVGMGYIDINTVLTVDNLNPTAWIFLSGKFDLKTGYHTLRFAEAITNEEGEPNYVEEANIEDYGTEKTTKGVSVGKPSSVTTNPGGSYIDVSQFLTSSSITGLAPIASPTFTGNPKAPTPSPGDDDTSIATTAFVINEISLFKGKDATLNKSADYTILLADFGANGNVTVFVDTTSGNISITLPSAASMNGYTANIIKVSDDTYSVEVVGTINGITNDIIGNQFEANTYKSNGTNFYKF